jgi:DNA-binding XRE family transcriptional regulator
MALKYGKYAGRSALKNIVFDTPLGLTATINSVPGARLGEGGKDVGELKNLRKVSGLTQWDLARVTGIDRSRICFIETERVQVRPEEERAIRRALDQAMRARLGTIQRALASEGAPASA